MTKIIYKNPSSVKHINRQLFLHPYLKGEVDSAIERREPVYVNFNYVMEKSEFVDGDSVYTIWVVGILPDGQKCAVKMTNIPIYVDVRCDETDVDMLRQLLRFNKINYDAHKQSFEMLRGYPADEFSHVSLNYVRIYFNTMYERKNAIEFLQKNGYKTASDDCGFRGSIYYFNKIAREKKYNSASWNVIRKWTLLPKYDSNGEIRYAAGQNTAYTFVVNDINNVERLTEENMAIVEKQYNEVITRRYTENPDPKRDVNYYLECFNKPRAIIITMDTETRKHADETGEPPRPGDNYDIFAMNSTIHYYYSREPLARVCVSITNVPLKDPAGRNRDLGTVIVAGNVTNVVMAFTEIVSNIAPEFLTTFNGGGFDWPLYYDKMKNTFIDNTPGAVYMNEKLSTILPYQYEVVQRTQKTRAPEDEKLKKIEGAFKKVAEEVLEQYVNKKTNMKISADESMSITTCNFPGIIDVDVFPMYKRLFPTAEVGRATGLNFYLKETKMESKEDMNYKVMFKIYDRSVAATKAFTAHKNTCGYFDENLEFVDAGIKNDVGNNTIDNINENIKCPICKEFKLATDDMFDVAYYCLIDAQRCQDLMVVRTIIDDAKELSSMSFTSMYDGIYRANGMKVRNLVGSEAIEDKIMFSNFTVAKKERRKYPGGHVRNPTKGLNTDRPVAGLDFSSLYPSIIMAFNLSPDMSLDIITPHMVDVGDRKYYVDVIVDGKQVLKKVGKLDYIEYLKSRGYVMAPVDYYLEEDGGEKPMQIKGCTIRHSNVTAADHEQSRINPANDKIRPYNEIDIVDGKQVPKYMERKVLPRERAGLFPKILKRLFDRRKIFKGQFVAYEKLIEKLEASHTAKRKGQPTQPVVAKDLVATRYEGSLETFEHIYDDDHHFERILSDLQFWRDKVNSKQKAAKVFMNTFYGEMGNANSQMYSLVVAGGVTMYGRQLIQHVERFMVSCGYKVYYGDTDSIYSSPPEHVFAQDRAVYDAEIADINASNADEETKKKLRTDARVKFWTIMVKLAQKDFDTRKNIVNNMLANYTGTPYLTMAYEEILFPCIFLGNKMYSGVEHIASVNFYPEPEKIFARGISSRRRGQAKLAREIGMKIYQEIFSPENEDDVRTCVLRTVERIYKTDWDISYFTITSKYKLPQPGKPGNVSKLKFIKRMQETREQCERANHPLTAAYPIVEPGDRYEYVVVVREDDWGIDGRKVKFSTSDCMEFKSVYIASQSTVYRKVVDVDHYMKGSIIASLARLISCEPEFQPPNEGAPLKYEEIDKFSNHAATKFIENYCDNFKERSKLDIRNAGSEYRANYRKIQKEIDEIERDRFGQMARAVRMTKTVEFEDSAVKNTVTKSANYGNTYGDTYVHENADHVQIKMLQENIFKMIQDEVAARDETAFGVEIIDGICKSAKDDQLKNKFSLRKVYMQSVGSNRKSLYSVTDSVLHNMNTMGYESLKQIIPHVHRMNQKHAVKRDAILIRARTDDKSGVSNDKINNNTKINASTAAELKAMYTEEDTALIKKFTECYERLVSIGICIKRNYAMGAAFNNLIAAPEDKIKSSMLRAMNDIEFAIIDH